MGDLAVFVFSAFLFGVLAQPFQVGLVQLLEGYGWFKWLPDVFVEISIERHWRNRAAASEVLAERRKSVKKVDRSVDLATLAAERRMQRREARALGEARARYYRYPAEDRIMPTMLGNVLRSGEDVAGGRYGLSSMTAYPRIYPYIHSRLDSALSRQLDLIATTAALCVAFGLAGVATVPVLFHHLSWGFVPGVSCVLSALSYSASLRAAASHGALFGAAFDLHRFDMLQGLHYPLPQDPNSEVAFNRALSQMWQRGLLADKAPTIRSTKYSHGLVADAADGAGPSSKTVDDSRADKSDGAEDAEDV